MRDWSKPAVTALLGLFLFGLSFYQFLAHPSFNYTFDGLAFSAQVEKDHEPLWLFFHPHHLLYTFMGRLFFLWGRAHGALWDGLVALQFLDIVTGALGVLIVFHLLVRETDDRLVALGAAAGLALSHSYWYFSTIPGVRIFATVTPLLAWYCLTYVRQLPPAFGWVLGGAHVLAILGHQTNLLLLPAFLCGIWCLPSKTSWEKLRTTLYYLVALTAGVLLAYGVVGRYIYFKRTFHDWLWWVFSYFHSPQNWGGHFQAAGFARGQSAMVRAFLPNVQPLETLGDQLTYGAAETILTQTVLVLLAILVLRLGYYWKNHRQVLLVALLWVAAFVPFFVWWEPWNIEFWVSSTVPCWVLMGVIASDLAKRWKNPVLHLANRATVSCAWIGLVAIFFFYNLEGSGAKPLASSHYDFKRMLAAVDLQVRKDDLLVLDGINNVHYYLDRFGKRPYMSLYSFLRKYKVLADKQNGREAEAVKDDPSAKAPDPWVDLDGLLYEAKEHHHRIWILTEVVDNFDGGRQLLEATLKLPAGRIRVFFKQYKLRPVPYEGKVYFYEVILPDRAPKN